MHVGMLQNSFPFEQVFIFRQHSNLRVCRVRCAACIHGQIRRAGLAIISDILCFFELGAKYSLLIIFEVSSLLLLVIATHYARFYSVSLFYFYQHYVV